MIITIIAIIIVSQPLAPSCTGQFRSPLLLFTPDVICISRGQGVETTFAKLPDYLIFKLNEQQIIANDVPPSFPIFSHQHSRRLQSKAEMLLFRELDGFFSSFPGEESRFPCFLHCPTLSEGLYT